MKKLLDKIKFLIMPNGCFVHNKIPTLTIMVKSQRLCPFTLNFMIPKQANAKENPANRSDKEDTDPIMDA